MRRPRLHQWVDGGDSKNGWMLSAQAWLGLFWQAGWRMVGAGASDIRGQPFYPLGAVFGAVGHRMISMGVGEHQRDQDSE